MPGKGPSVSTKQRRDSKAGKAKHSKRYLDLAKKIAKDEILGFAEALAKCKGLDGLDGVRSTRRDPRHDAARRQSRKHPQTKDAEPKGRNRLRQHRADRSGHQRRSTRRVPSGEGRNHPRLDWQGQLSGGKPP